MEAKAGNDEQLYLRFIGLYSRFLSVLVSSFPKYLQEVTRKLISEFKLLDHAQKAPHHEILSKIVRFIPTCINTFPSTFQSFFPHHLSSSTHELTHYVDNLLTMVEYCPDLQFNVWQIIMECCIKLDVELQNELDDLDDDEIDEVINGVEEEDENDDEDSDDENAGEDEEEKKTVYQSEDEDEEEDDDEMIGETEYLTEQVNSSAHIKMLASKLDSVMNLLLTRTLNSFTPEKINNGEAITLFNTISSLFKSHILPTHFTKSIQFVLFQISLYQPELADSFLVLIIDVAFNNKEILEKRLKAMQYLSSYIARAKNLSKHQIVFVTSFLVGWLDKYIKERESEVYDSSNPQDGEKQASGMERFKLFYATFQALLYIFCFRHEQLYAGGQARSDLEWECDLDKFFQRVILAKFNPLKFCDETVVSIFAKLATKLNVCYCYSIIEHNKRERMLQANGSMPSSISNFKQKQEFLDFEAYFPFDPMVLPISKLIVKPNYVEWSDVNPSNDDEDDEDSASLQEVDSDISSDEEITSDEEI